MAKNTQQITQEEATKKANKIIQECVRFSSPEFNDAEVALTCNQLKQYNAQQYENLILACMYGEPLSIHRYLIVRCFLMERMRLDGIVLDE